MHLERTMREKPNQQEQKLVDQWNAKHPTGTPVRYWTMVREGAGRTSTTRSVAELLSGHTAVVWLAGVSGCVSLSHVEAIT